MKGVTYHRRLAVLTFGTILGACSSPNPTLYTIAPVAGTEQSYGPKVVLLQQIGLDRYLVLSPSEAAAGAAKNPSILADVCEAVIAAVYRDANLDVARRIFAPLWPSARMMRLYWGRPAPS